MTEPREPVHVPRAVRALAVFLMCAALTLGGWQVQRDAERNEGRAAALETQGAPVLTAQVPVTAQLAWRVVRWRGRFEGRPHLIAGRQNRSALGYGVAQRFVREDGVALLVDRGWVDAAEVAAAVARTEPSDESELTGQLRPVFGRADVVATPGHGTEIWPAKAWPSIQGATHTRASVYVVSGAEHGGPSANSHALDGFVRVPPRDQTSLHYASQWFALALLAGIALIPGAATRARDFLGA